VAEDVSWHAWATGMWSKRLHQAQDQGRGSCPAPLCRMNGMTAARPPHPKQLHSRQRCNACIQSRLHMVPAPRGWHCQQLAATSTAVCARHQCCTWLHCLYAAGCQLCSISSGKAAGCHQPPRTCPCIALLQMVNTLTQTLTASSTKTRQVATDAQRWTSQLHAAHMPGVLRTGSALLHSCSC